MGMTGVDLYAAFTGSCMALTERSPSNSHVLSKQKRVNIVTL